jgi:hypothetical protein
LIADWSGEVWFGLVFTILLISAERSTEEDESAEVEDDALNCCLQAGWFRFITDELLINLCRTVRTTPLSKSDFYKD